MSYAFDTYRNEVMALVRSIVLKLDIQNELNNTRLKQHGIPVNDNDPYSWKYNLNLAGEYHFQDKRMTVVSSDTQQPISFDKETLKDHPRTRIEYGRGGRFYESLVNRYPVNEILINAITRPINIDRVVNAGDWEIIDYNPRYVGENEIYLMDDLQTWINNYTARWFNKDFMVSDVHYPAVFLSMLYMQLPSVIMNIRLKYAKTPFASEFHIWSFLGSHYELDRYRKQLSTNQALWLYRNIVEIRTETGRRDKLVEMLNEILTPAGVGLDRMAFLQTTENVLSTGAPTPKYSFLPLESEKIDYASGNFLTTRSAFNLTRYKALSNDDDMPDDIPEAQTRTEEVHQTKLPTKLTRAYENGQVASQTIETIGMKIDYWAYLAAYDIYNPDYAIQIPNGPSRILSAKDAFLLMIYALFRSAGRKPDVIPTFKLWGMVPLSYPYKEQLQPLKVNGVITDEDIDYVLSRPIDVFAVQDQDSFNRLIERAIEKSLIQELWWESPAKPIHQSLRKDLCMATWSIPTCQFANEDTEWFDWLGTAKIDDTSINEQEWGELVVEILRVVVGFEEVQGKMGLRQAAMVDILDRLSSYHIMTVRDGSGRRGRRVEIPNTMIYDLHYRFFGEWDVQTGLQFLENHKATKQHYQWRGESGLEFTHHDRVTMTRYLESGSQIIDNRRERLSHHAVGKHSFITNNSED